MKRAIFLLMAGWLASCGTAPAVAQDPPGELKPILIVAAPSYQNFLDDMSYVGGMTNADPRFKDEASATFVREFGKIVGEQLQMGPIDFQAIDGLDRSRPCGMMVVTDGVLIAPLAFLPVTDLPAFLKSVEGMIGPAEDAGNGVYEIGKELTSGVIQIVGDWAYITQTVEHASWMPEPMEMLGDLHTRYDVVAQIDVQNIPEVFRDFAVDMIRTQFQGETGPEGFSDQLRLLPFDLLQRVLTEAERVTMGLSIDEDGQKATTETHIKPLPGSRLATQIDATSETQTAFGGLDGFEDQVLKMNFSAPLDSEAVAELTGLIEGYGVEVAKVLEQAAEFESDEDRQEFVELSSQLMDQFKASVAEGQIDAGVAIYGKRPPFSVLAASRVADGKAVESIFLRLSEFAENDPGIDAVELNAGEHGGATIHSVTMGSSPDFQMIGKLFGLKVYLAFADDRIYAAAGGNALADLKKLIDGKPTTVTPVQIDAMLASVVRMMSESLEDQTQRTVAAVMAMNLASAGGDATSMTVAPTEDGELRIYSESASGILRTFAVALPLVLQLSQPGSGGAPF